MYIIISLFIIVWLIFDAIKIKLCKHKHVFEYTTESLDKIVVVCKDCNHIKCYYLDNKAVTVIKGFHGKLFKVTRVINKKKNRVENKIENI